MADRRGLTTPTAYRALDFSFRIEAPEPLLPLLEEILAPLECGAEEEPDPVSVRFDGQTWRIDGTDIAVRSLGAIVARVLEYINRRAAASVDGMPLHGATVRSPHGLVIAAVGRSGAGKSTLCAAAIAAGWGFVAEEITAVEPHSLTVRPYHRPIGLRKGGATALGIDHPEPADGRFDVVHPFVVPVAMRRGAARLGGIALIDRVDGVPRLVDVPPAQALAALVEHAVVPRDDRVVEVFEQLAALVRRVPVVRLDYGDPTAGLRLLAEWGRSWPG